MSGVIQGVNDIKTCNPEIAKQWDYDKNNGVTPETIAIRSNKKVWWKCERGHSFEVSPDHRARGQNCPYCSGKKVLSGFNDLQTVSPKMLVDWDYEKNGDLLPSMITAGSKKNIWWKCHVCNFSWQVSPNSRKFGERGCPKCSESKRRKSFRKAFLQEGKNDLLSQAPDILKEWDYGKNLGLDPEEYTINSKEKVWWKCIQCGNLWQATIKNRIRRNSGCPICKKHKRTSFPEQAIFYYLQKIYPEAENSYAKLEDKTSLELDVYIPKIGVGIEYDGVAWHKNENSNKRDHKKFLLCKKMGIKLYRVSEFERENDAECDILVLRRENTDNGLNVAITDLLVLLGVTNYDVDVVRDRSIIMKQYVTYIAEKSIAARYPEEVVFWDVEKNNGLTADMINATSNVNYWWKCYLGHNYKATPANRLGTGNGCPYCSGKRVLEGFNDLQTRYPDIAREWDYEMNSPLKPTNVTPGSQKKIWWRCSYGHKYQCFIGDKVTTQRKCPYCTNRLTMTGFNDLRTTNPELAKEWDYEKNLSITITDVNKVSSQKVWWKCDKGHSWKATINTRAKGAGCPYCCNRYVLEGYNDLLTIEPDIAQEWDYDKNQKLRPENVVAGSSQKVWWICSKGHSWKASVTSRATSNTGCPFCVNQKFASGYNDLKTMYPVLAKEWNVEKNDGVLPENVVAGGGKKVWWCCDKGHEWKAAIYSRISGRGCPYCSNKKLLPGYNDFATVYPDFSHEWNYEKNGDLKPEMVSCGSMTKVWWKCSEGHEWFASPNQRRRQDGTLSTCAYCAGKKAIPGKTDLCATRPDLIQEWDYDRNIILPTEVKLFSAKKVWWKCSKCGFEWQALISNRSNGSGCPRCAKAKKGNRR